MAEEKNIEPRARSWKTRSFRPDDFPRVSEFIDTLLDTDNGSPGRGADYYQWKCLGNPVLPGEILLAEDGDTLVATKTLTPKRFRISGQVISGAEMGDSFTHPNYQGQGIFSTLTNIMREKALERGMNLIYSTPNANTSLPIYEKIGFARIPGVNLVSLVRPLNMKAALTEVINFRPLVTIASPLLNIVYIVLFKLSEKRKGQKGITVSRLDSFPDDIERLWEEASKSYDIILVRDRDYLEWRYITNPESYSILIARDDKATVGYLVVKTRPWRKLKLGCIADFLVANEDTRVFKALLVEAIRIFQESEADLIYCWAIKGSPFHRVLRRAGFLQYKRVPIICYQNELGNKIIQGEYVWHFTIGDSDNI